MSNAHCDLASPLAARTHIRVSMLRSDGSCVHPNPWRSTVTVACGASASMAQRRRQGTSEVDQREQSNRQA